MAQKHIEIAMITKLQITGKLHYHRKCDFQLSKRKLGYRTLLPLTAPMEWRAAFCTAPQKRWCDSSTLMLLTGISGMERSLVRMRGADGREQMQQITGAQYAYTLYKTPSV